MRSRDEWDAVALTFAEPVNPERIVVDTWQPVRTAGGWMAN